MNTLQDFSNDDFLSSLIETSINDRFHCDQCERTYSSAKLLRQHQAQHHNNASQTYVDVTVFDPYSKTCYVCNRRFSRLGAVQKHYTIVHNMKGPLSCSHEGCDLHFFTEKALSRHKNKCVTQR